MTDVYLGLGSNLGDRHAMLLSAIEALVQRVGNLIRCSSFIQTEPWGFSSKHPFLNAVVVIRTALSPRELLQITQEIERQLGRTHKSHNKEYADRTIDIDILYYDQQEVNEPDLQIPHPRIQEREFVLRSLHELGL